MQPWQHNHVRRKWQFSHSGIALMRYAGRSIRLMKCAARSFASA